MKLSTIGAAFAAFALCAVAGAQTTNAPVGAAVRLGFFVPTNDDVNGSFVAFGADYNLTKYQAPFRIKGFASSITGSVDYYRRDDYGNIPVLLNYVAKKGDYAFSVGAGVGFGTEPGRSDANFAYQASVTYDLPTNSEIPFFFQGKFLGSDRSALDGFGFYVGVRF